MINYYTDLKPRVDLALHHDKKTCLRGTCVIENGKILSRCERHHKTPAIVRRYLRLKKFKAPTLTEERIEQTLGTYNHADRSDWQRRFPI